MADVGLRALRGRWPRGQRSLPSRVRWNNRGELIRTLDDQPRTIMRAAFSADDRFLITARYPDTFLGDRRLLVLRDGRTGR